MQVRPRAREYAAQGEVLKVGAQLVPIRATLSVMPQGRPETGLPIIVSVPAGMKVFPGELVELRLLPMPPPKPAEATPSPAKQPSPPAQTSPAPKKPLRHRGYELF